MCVDSLAIQNRMPSLETTGWELEDAEERSARTGGRFKIPSAEERQSLRPGQRVKLLFLFVVKEGPPMTVQGERMWVTVTSCEGGSYTGVLESLPQLSDSLSPGTTIEFTPNHVAAVLIPVTDPRHPDYRPSA